MTDDVAGDLRDLIRASAAYDIIAIHHAIYKIERLLVENRNLRRALRPFAAIGRDVQPGVYFASPAMRSGNGVIYRTTERTYRVTETDCRRAYETLKETER